MKEKKEIRRIEVTIAECSPSYIRTDGVEMIEIKCTVYGLEQAGFLNACKAVQEVIKFISDQNGYKTEFGNNANDKYAVWINSAIVKTKRFWSKDKQLIDWIDEQCTLFVDGSKIKLFPSHRYLDSFLD